MRICKRPKITGSIPLSQPLEFIADKLEEVKEYLLNGTGRLRKDASLLPYWRPYRYDPLSNTYEPLW